MKAFADLTDEEKKEFQEGFDHIPKDVEAIVAILKESGHHALANKVQLFADGVKALSIEEAAMIGQAAEILDLQQIIAENEEFKDSLDEVNKQFDLLQED